MPVSKDTGIFSFQSGLFENFHRHADFKPAVAVVDQVLAKHRAVGLGASLLQGRQRFTVSAALTCLRIDRGESIVVGVNMSVSITRPR